MGTTPSKPTNKVGKKVVKQKLESASKTGVLSLREHRLESIPSEVYSLTKLRTLDISKNKIEIIPSQLSALTVLKSLNCDDNSLSIGSLHVLSNLDKLQILSANGNSLGRPLPSKKKGSATKQKQPVAATPKDLLPSKMPPLLKQVSLASNYLWDVPTQLLSLSKLEKLDLSKNGIASVTAEIMALTNLTELNLDDNCIVSLPKDIGHLKKLKTLSLRNNRISLLNPSMKLSDEKNPQPLPSSLFTNTPLIDLNLHGNPMTNTQLNEFEGFESFLERRQKIKSKNIYGGALTDLGVCGLK